MDGDQKKPLNSTSVGFALTPEHVAAVARLAVHFGHLNRSRVIRDLIDEKMTELEGADWEARIFAGRRELVTA